MAAGFRVSAITQLTPVLAEHQDASGRNDVAPVGPGYHAKWSGRSFS